ncbi:MAG: ribonuclease III domain-containing protein [Methanoregula sp.]|jgi:ribonuclease-3|nr:ribonuclease III domain-containing protein [Methanoregula sp.]
MAKSVLEKDLKYTFKDKKHLNRALTHPTFAHEQQQKEKASEYPDQQVYATFGDSILKTILIDLFLERKMSTKGIITIKKQDIESDLKLAEVGKRLQLIELDLIKFSKGGKNQTAQGEKTFLADTVEALIAAIFIDSGYSYKKTKRCVRRLFKDELDKLGDDIS